MKGFERLPGWARLAALAVSGIGLGLVVLAFVWLTPAKALPPREVTLQAVRVPLSESAPEATMAGRLRFVDGVALSADDPGFGGLSALRVRSVDGARQIVGVTDSGESFVGALRLEGGRIAGVGPLRMAPLSDLRGRAIAGKRWGDSESLTELPGGRWLVGFERRHRLWSYAASFDGPAQALDSPEGLERAPANGGLEAIASWPDGRVVALTEQLAEADGARTGFLFDDSRWRRFEWRTSDPGFDPSDATVLPGGDLLVLERRWSAGAPLTLRCRLLRAPRAALRAGATTQGELLAEFSDPFVSENFEGVASFEDASRPGAVQILLLSDDNFSPAQRTLLLWLELPALPEPADPSPEAPLIRPRNGTGSP